MRTNTRNSRLPNLRRWPLAIAPIIVCGVMLLCSAGVHAQATEVEVFTLQNRLAAELVDVVAPLAAPEGVVRASGNNLIVRAAPARLADIRQVIAKLDTPAKQLLISVRQGASLESQRRSASVSGRIGNEDAGIVLPPQGRENANVIVRDGQGNVVRGGISDSTQRNQNTSTQQLRVLEGQSALIQVGQQRAVVQRQVLPSVGRPVVIEQPVVQDATTGFRVLPRVQGQQFSLDISPQQANFNNRGGVDVQRLTTRVSGPLGQWVDIGGAVTQQTTQSSGLGASASQTASRDNSVLVKVEVLP